MKSVFSILTGLFLVLAPAARADSPVVIELYTSQGCSSCPPADALMHELAKRDDVIPLALHVDYWDYIGWKDEFAHAAFSQRQRAYATVAGRRMVYTPQMIIDGQDAVVGNRPMEVADLIQAHKAKPGAVQLTLARSGGTLTVTGQQTAPGKVSDVILVRYAPSRTVDILRGENAGHTLTYANVVTEWRPIGTWSGSGPLSLTADVGGSNPVAVIVQVKGQGAILGSASLR